MPRTRAGAAASHNSDVAEEPTESEEQVDLDGDNDPEETMEEEVEEEEEVKEEEEEIEEEEEDEEEKEAAKGDDVQKGSHGDYAMKVDQAVENVRRKHAELLSLPPHGSEVYLGGIPHMLLKRI
jgi:heterogeneous nuclear ribonucleoprotein R